MVNIDYSALSAKIKTLGQDLGFAQLGITDIDLSRYQENFLQWLLAKFHGKMYFMEAHGTKRYHPEELLPGTIRVIAARMDYLPPNTNALTILHEKQKAYISRYALGKDYHKLIRKRLARLANKINEIIPHSYRAFSDSAPILEKPLAEKAGLGWIGKNTLLLNPNAGSWFFLGEIFTNLPLPMDKPIKEHCGTCTACIDICPTKAIVAPFKLDARRCISYLTIELRSSIPVELRPLIGNRIYGCDDCQLVCPWNRFAKFTREEAFHPKHQLDHSSLLTLFSWNQNEFLKKTEGSSIRRIGFDCWQRNIAVALGNANYDENIVVALEKKLTTASELVKEHILWALTVHAKTNNLSR